MRQRRIGQVYLIAEGGVNHNGSVETAKKLIDVAVSAGCNAIKFQAFIPDVACDGNEILRKILHQTHLTFSQLSKLKEYCGAKIDFLLSAFDLETLEWLPRMGLTTLKIPSGRNTNIEYLEKARNLYEGIILSTGMCTFENVQQSVKILQQGIEPKNIAILHCTSSYPCLLKYVNLLAMVQLKKITGIVGLSDHTAGLTASLGAVALGAQIIERHITLDKKMKGPDHASSLEPNELFSLVCNVRDMEKCLGNGVKKIEEPEKEILWRKTGKGTKSNYYQEKTE